MSKIYSKKYKCPICGRPHTLEVTDDVGCFLDGVPYQTMESMMKMVALCENCGVLYTTSKFDANVDEQTAWRSEEYQQAYQASYRDMTEKKLALFDAMYHPTYMPLYYAHYYREVGDAEQESRWLSTAIANIESGADEEEYNMDGMDFVAYHIQGVFHLTPEVRVVDLYRRAGEYDKALQHIAQLKCTPEYEMDNALMQYIEYQEMLLASQNTNLV